MIWLAKNLSRLLGGAVLLIAFLLRLSVWLLSILGGAVTFWPEGWSRMKAYQENLALSEDEGLNAMLRGSRRVTHSATCGYHLLQADKAKAEGRPVPRPGWVLYARLLNPLLNLLFWERDHCRRAARSTRHLGIGHSL